MKKLRNGRFNGKYSQGYFKPKNPNKYVGDINNIVFMSSYELSFFQFLDNNNSIIAWASEEISIPYVKPTTGRIHKYYPDVWVKYKNKKGKLIQDIIEIKPEKQIRKPTIKGKSKKTQIYEAVQWSVNVAKWKSAKLFCDKYGFNFKVMSEKQIFR